MVIDTSIWRSHLLLKTPIGKSLVYALGRAKGFIGLPEVVEGELIRQVLELRNEAAEPLGKWSRIINTLADSPFDVSIPDDGALKEKVADRLRELDPILKRVPFTLDHAKAALEMVNAKVPPNGEHRQEFKDSAIWQAVLSLSSEYCVHLVTKDRGFLADPNDPSKGLAKNLQEDCSGRGVRVGVYCDLAACLKKMTHDVPAVDHACLRELILPFVEKSLQMEAARHGFLVGSTLKADITAFRVAKEDRLAVDYEVAAQCRQNPSVPTDGRADMRAIAHGSGYYNPVGRSLSGHFLQYVTFEWSYAGGGHGRICRSYEGEDVPSPFRRPIPQE
ncbi:MAG: DUF4935 domain-containing protein [Phycisphaerae bacterium]|nr:DUF4935 domain-containing protein [Phycisphaerae bacterium]